MSTESHIGILHANGKIEVSYCKYDGNPEHNGAIFFANYNDFELANWLVSGGNFESLGFYEDATKYFEDVDDNEPERFESISDYLKKFKDDFSNIDWAYLYDENKDKWLVAHQPTSLNDFKFLESVLDSVMVNESQSDLTYARIINFFNEIKDDNQDLVDYLKNEKGLKDGSWNTLAQKYSIFDPDFIQDITDYFIQINSETNPVMG